MAQPTGIPLARFARAVVLSAVLIMLAACGQAGDSSATEPTATSSSDQKVPTWTLVALGDSWPEGAHCGYCRTFAGRYADGVESRSGRSIKFKDLTGAAEPYWETMGGGTEGLLKALRSDQAFRDEVATGDIILIAHGPNEGSRVDLPYKPEACGGSDGLACIRELGRFWYRNFDAILDEIELLRGGKPTAIRLVNAANVFVADPAAAKGMGKGFATGVGAQMFRELTNAVCKNADEHGAICVDVGPILTGPNQDQAVDENSPASMQAVADALLATGLPELE